ncbi:MAG: branched-chain amino acid ABC transporter permease [Actinocatenispora sp.]
MLGSNLVSFVDGIAFGLLLFTLAVGLSLVFGMMNVLNLAHGTFYLLGAYLTYLLSGGSVLSLGLALLVGLLAGGVGGALLAGLVRPLTDRGHLDQAVLTLGVAFIAADLFSSVFGAGNVPADPPAALTGSISVADQRYPTYRLLFIAVAALLAVLLYLTFERSRFGTLVRATVADRQMVRAMGVDTRKVLAVGYAAGGALAVVGGVLGAPILGPGPGVDSNVLVLSLVVVVIGGLGSVRGALVGALLVGEVQTLGVALLPEYASFLLFGIMLAVLAVRPRGLLPVAGRSG